MIDFKKLQNGSDIRGVAIQTEGGPEPNLTKETAGQIAGSFIYWLSKKVQKNPVMLKVCVGQDSRISGDMLKENAAPRLLQDSFLPHSCRTDRCGKLFRKPVVPEQASFPFEKRLRAGCLSFDDPGCQHRSAFFPARDRFKETRHRPTASPVL